MKTIGIVIAPDAKKSQIEKELENLAKRFVLPETEFFIMQNEALMECIEPKGMNSELLSPENFFTKMAEDKTRNFIYVLGKITEKSTLENLSACVDKSNITVIELTEEIDFDFPIALKHQIIVEPVNTDKLTNKSGFGLFMQQNSQSPTPKVCRVMSIGKKVKDEGEYSEGDYVVVNPFVDRMIKFEGKEYYMISDLTDIYLKLPVKKYTDPACEIEFPHDSDLPF